MFTNKLELNRLLSKWNDFWFTKKAPELLGIFRIFLALVVFYRITHHFELDKLTLWEPKSELGYLANYFYTSYFEWLKPPSFEFFSLIINIRNVLIFFLFIGLFSQLSALLIGSIHLYIFFLDQNLYFHHLYFLGLTCFISGFMPCGKRFSVDALIAKLFKRPKCVDVSYVAVNLLKLLVSFMYFFTALAKTTGEWLSGDILKYCYDMGIVQPEGLFKVLGSIPYAWQAWATILIEYFLFWALWFRKTKWVAIALGVSFHLMMDITMPISSYSQQMIVVYILFLDPSQARRCWARVREYFVKALGK